MKCQKIYKKNNSVFMIDSRENTVELTDNTQLNEYENKNSVQLLPMLNNFFEREDNKNHKVLVDVVRLAREKNIDHFAYGEVGGPDIDTCILEYCLNNRESFMHCNLRVFYKERSNLSFIISFGSGTSGTVPGFEYYLKFDHKNYTADIKPLIEKYFSLFSEANQEIEFLNYFRTKVENRIRYYYSK